MRTSFLCLLYLFIAITSWGQLNTDTTQSPGIPLRHQLLKAGMNLPLFRQSSVTVLWQTVGIDIAYERRLVKGLTLVAGLETNIAFSRATQLYTVELPAGLRYYFAIGKSMRRRTDNWKFFSPYLGVQTHNILFANLRYNAETDLLQRAGKYYRGRYLSTLTNAGNLTEAFNMLQNAYFLVGTQWRLSRNHYLDINVPIPISLLAYNKTEYTLTSPAYLTIKYGIWW